MSNGFAFSLIWNVLENGYLEPHNVSRIDFNKERGRVRTLIRVTRKNCPIFGNIAKTVAKISKLKLKVQNISLNCF